MVKVAAILALAGTAIAGVLPAEQPRWVEERSDLKAQALKVAESQAADLAKRGFIGTEGDAPDPTQVQIVGVTYGGTGCPNLSVGSAISADRTVMTLIFDQYVASIGPGISITESRKNCQLNLNLKYPSGFQYSIFSADYRGYAALDKGVKGTQKSTYYFSGQTAQTSTGTTWTGPFSGNYLNHDTADSQSIVWSPCGSNAMLNINSQISLTSSVSGAQGLLTTDSIDTKFTQVVYITWLKC